MTNQEDVLECLRPFCADVMVSAAVKTTVLQLMEESFDLSGEDTFLLLLYQTDAVVSSTWNRKVAFLFLNNSSQSMIVSVLLYNSALSMQNVGFPWQLCNFIILKMKCRLFICTFFLR